MKIKKKNLYDFAQLWDNEIKLTNSTLQFFEKDNGDYFNTNKIFSIV